MKTDFYSNMNFIRKRSRPVCHAYGDTGRLIYLAGSIGSGIHVYPEASVSDVVSLIFKIFQNAVMGGVVVVVKNMCHPIVG